MWILSFLPTGFLEFIINAVLFLSIVGIVIGFVGSKLPFVGSYSTIIKYASIVFFCIGLYWKGGFSVEKEWRARVEEMQEKVRLAEEKSEKANTEIKTKIVEKTKIIREKGEIQIEYINRLVEGKTVEIIKDLSEEQKQEFLAKQRELQDALDNCPVPRIIVEEHNKAVELK
jgi:energy-coupling factor transporter transmembrane protein EcfT